MGNKKAVPVRFIVTNFTFLYAYYEPGRIYNQNAHPPEIVIYNFDNIPPGKHINGTIVINFYPFDLTSNVKTVKVFVDTIPIVTANNLPYQFYLIQIIYRKELQCFLFTFIWKTIQQGS